MAITKKIRVTHLIDFLGPGGAQEILKYVFKYSPPDIEHVVVALTDTQPIYQMEYQKNGIGTHYLSRASKTTLPFYLPILIAGARRLLKKEKPNVLHLHLPGAMITGCLASASLGIPKILSIYAWRAQLPYWVYPAIRVCEPMLAKVECISERELEWVPKSKIVKAFPGADPETDFADGAEKVRQEFGLQGKGPFFFSVGRFHSDKGHETAIRAYQAVARELPLSRLILIGGGDLKQTEQLKTAAARSEGDKILFAGHRKDLSSFFGLGGFFLRASKNECVNMSTITAQLAGLVPIGFDMKGVLPVDDDCIDHGVNGSLIPRGEIDAMGREALRIWRDKALFGSMSQASRRYALENWDIRKTMVEPLAAAYREMSQ